MFEWFNPIYLADRRSNFTTRKFVDNKVLLEMKELVSNYKPWVIWSDGDWEANDTYWRSTDFLAWLVAFRFKISFTVDVAGSTMRVL